MKDLTEIAKEDKIEFEIDKGGLQLTKRLKFSRLPTPKILSANVEDDKLSILCYYNWDPNQQFKIDTYRLDKNWEKIQSNMERIEEKSGKFRISVPFCIPGSYKIGATEQGHGTSKLSYESIVIRNKNYAGL